jgi:hypothetical protein
LQILETPFKGQGSQSKYYFNDFLLWGQQFIFGFGILIFDFWVFVDKFLSCQNTAFCTTLAALGMFFLLPLLFCINSFLH